MAKHGQAAARIKKGNPGGAEILVYHTGRKEAESLGNPKGGKKKVQGRGVGTRWGRLEGGEGETEENREAGAEDGEEEERARGR